MHWGKIGAECRYAKQLFSKWLTRKFLLWFSTWPMMKKRDHHISHTSHFQHFTFVGVLKIINVSLEFSASYLREEGGGSSNVKCGLLKWRRTLNCKNKKTKKNMPPKYGLSKIESVSKNIYIYLYLVCTL